MRSNGSIIRLALTMAAILALVNLVNAGSATTSASGPASAAPVGVAVAPNSTAPLTPVGSGFTYQGSLKNGGSPANGQYDFEFTLYDSLTAGNMVGSTVTTGSVTVAGGLFTVTLDFGTNAFQGQARWLEIAVRTAGGGSYTTLSPRQPLTAVPYAMSLATGSTGAVISGTVAGPALIVTNTLGTGVRGSSTFSPGVYGNSTYDYGVHGNSTSSYGVYGGSNSNYGMYGITSGEPSVAGVYGQSYGLNGRGVRGVANYGTSAYGVYGTSSNGFGVVGNSGSGIGVDGHSDSSYGVVGSTNGGSSVAGVHGQSNGTGGRGVWGVANGGASAVAILGVSTSGYAGWFTGNTHVQGNFSASGTKNFKIDHPLDPANKYLYHASVESPDVLNMYNGNVTTDAKGEAVVTLPSYFEALNKDFRYQLTPIGQFAQAIVASEVKNNSFTIKTDKPNVKVSWQVTGIRQDPYVKDHSPPVEQDKPADEKGKYIYPQGYGQPESKSVDYGWRQAQKEAPKAPEPKP